MDKENTLLITGGAGFIGSNYARMALERHPELRVVVYDKLTYAGNLQNLTDLAFRFGPRYAFVQGDIADPEAVEAAFRQHAVDAVVNFAAATHVDRSILGAEEFIQTEVFGTYTLLEAARRHGVERYLQVSSDEVYGQVLQGAADEGHPLTPRNPYAAAKAGGDLLALSYHTTHGVPVLITRGCNTFGPYQYPEKVVPLFVTNAIDDQPLPLYGDGRQEREWMYVLDHCAAIDLVLRQGQPGQVYNVGTGEHQENIALTRLILGYLEKPESLIQHVQDRPGHDHRYALDSAKLRALGWRPERSFEEALAETVAWYRQHPEWWRPLKSGEFLEYYRRQYGERLKG
ncbi:MAG: dTDP-glucose 4,6-dehydratase [Chloroflexi bacterium]|nr:dTDP-glucose 4,6-dehydratase [Chloroflexota bacterium]